MIKKYSKQFIINKKFYILCECRALSLKHINYTNISEHASTIASACLLRVYKFIFQQLITNQNLHSLYNKLPLETFIFNYSNISKRSNYIFNYSHPALFISFLIWYYDKNNIRYYLNETYRNLPLIKLFSQLTIIKILHSACNKSLFTSWKIHIQHIHISKTIIYLII